MKNFNKGLSKRCEDCELGEQAPPLPPAKHHIKRALGAAKAHKIKRAISCDEIGFKMYSKPDENPFRSRINRFDRNLPKENRRRS